MRSNLSPRVAASSLLALAAVLRLWALGGEGLWVDEAYTSGLIQGSFGAIVARLKLDDAPPLFYFLEKLIVPLLGGSELALRALPALAGIALVVLLGAIARRINERSALFAMALAAGSVLLLFHSRQARSYSLLQVETAALLFLVTSGALDRRRVLAIAALCLAAIYTHNLGLWPVVATAILLLPRFRGPERGAVALTGALVAIGALPWFLRLGGQLDVHRELNAWMARYWDHRPILLAPFYSLFAFVNGGATAARAPIFLGGGRGDVWATILLSVLVAIALGLGALRAWRGGDRERELVRAALVFLLVPLVGLLLATLVTGPAYVLGRTDSTALPAFLLLVALGLARNHRLCWPTLLLWFATAGIGLWPSWTAAGDRAKGSDRALAEEIGRRLGTRDAVVLATLTRPTLEYYAERQDWRDRVTWFGGFPTWVDENPAATYPSPSDSLAAWHSQALALRRNWESQGVERVWLLALREGNALKLRLPWPRRPAEPPPERRSLGAGDLQYPNNLVAAALVGLNSIDSRLEYQQDWVTGDRLLIEIPRSQWVPVDSLPRIEMRP